MLDDAVWRIHEKLRGKKSIENRFYGISDRHVKKTRAYLVYHYSRSRYPKEPENFYYKFQSITREW